MGVSDFDSLVPSEFEAVYTQWTLNRRREYSEMMGAVRLHAAITVQPHCRKRIKPEDLFAIPMIDGEQREDNTGGVSPKLTKEERRARFEELKKLRGYGG